MQKYFYTKYALTKGIIVFEGEVFQLKESEPLYITEDSRSAYRIAGKLGVDVFATEAEARSRVDVMLKRKFVSLGKQLQHLKTMSGATAPISTKKGSDEE